MSFKVLSDTADSWAVLLPEVPDHYDGSAALLRTARSLFVHSWFDYEFMAVGCLIALQAVEAAIRLLYPEAEKVPARALARRAAEDKHLPQNIADLAITGFELRNQFSHPATQGVFTPGMAASVLENSHHLVALVLASVAVRDAESI